MGSTAFWAALKRYVADHRYGLSNNTILLDALDDATSVNLGSSLFAPRFPTIY
jgi:hypothetical protein